MLINDINIYNKNKRRNCKNTIALHMYIFINLNNFLVCHFFPLFIIRIVVPINNCILKEIIKRISLCFIYLINNHKYNLLFIYDSFVFYTFNQNCVFCLNIINFFINK